MCIIYVPARRLTLYTDTIRPALTVSRMVSRPGRPLTALKHTTDYYIQCYFFF